MADTNDFTAQALYKSRKADRQMMELPIDVTLPEIPNDNKAEKMMTEPFDTGPVAVYTHVPLSERSKLQILEQMSSAEDGNTFVWAPHCDQVGQPLSASYDRQLELVTSQLHEYISDYFVAVVHPDWKLRGVIVVNMFHEARLDEMEEDESDSRIQDRQSDKIFVPVEEAGSVIANCQIANMEWDDFFEMFADYQVDSGPAESVSLREKLQYTIAVYNTENVDPSSVLRALGQWDNPVGSAKFFPFHQAGSVPLYDSVSSAESLHHQRIAQIPSLHRSMYILADKSNLETYGVQLCTIQDDDNDLESDRLFCDKRPKALRVPAAFQTTLVRFATAAEGRDPRHSSTPLFIGQNVYASLLSPELDRFLEKHHVLSAPFVCVPPGLDIDQTAPRSIEDAIKLFPVLYREERFQPNVSKDLFVYRFGMIRDSLDACLIVRVNWDGEVFDRSVEELWELDLMQGAEVMRCSVSEVDELLLALASGRRAWEGEHIGDEVKRWAGIPM